MADLPTGTITFLFTDVEGSTRLWEAQPQAMRQVMARHDALLTAIFERHDGVVVRPRGEGDSLFCVFVRASAAVAAALAGQRALAAEDWGEIGPLRVRMALHTGEADLREGDYYGSAVNRCARIRAAGHGGQVLLSEATARLVREALPAGASLRELGRHRLKDLAEPEQLYQLTAPGLPDSFPPLKTLESRPNNLPLQLTSFLGRERELADLVRLLTQARLVTLTGAGGTGKTRLALQAAAATIDAFPDGVFFVDLAPLTDPAAVPAAVALVLGVQERPGVPLRETLGRALREKRLLLVLDNYEHVLDAAEFAAVLLQAAPAITLLVTSRTVLRLRGEREYPLALLPLPAEGERHPAALTGNAAVQLFVARAQEARPDFGLSEENAAATAAICARLDGLPLAIELAAARVRSLSPAALLGRLANPLPLLTGGPRDAPARQQTLRDAIGWSYTLLSAEEQRLLQRLSVFAGGCTLELAEAVGNADGDLGIEVFDGISSLVEKSLVREASSANGEPRYRMLGTIREFALEQLEASAEAEALRRQLALQVVDLVERSVDTDASTRLEPELDNLRAALGWCVARRELDVGVRLFWSAHRFLADLGLPNEAETWRQRLLALPEAAEPNVSRARLLACAVSAYTPTTALEAAERGLYEAVALSRELGDSLCLAEALGALAFRSFILRGWDELDPLAEEASELFYRLGRVDRVATVGTYPFSGALVRGEVARAESLFAALQETLGSAGRRTRAILRAREGQLAIARGEFGRARTLLEEATRELRVIDGANSNARLLFLAFLAWAELLDGDTAAAAARLTECFGVNRRVKRIAGTGGGGGVWSALSCVSVAAARAGMPRQAARLEAVASVWRPGRGGIPVQIVMQTIATTLERLQDELGEDAFSAERATGAALSVEEAIDLGLAVAEELVRLHGPPAAAPATSPD
ncbi:MAG TPA: adenylate/guanylate cyclase domain-containing protein [Dehalococcoidia bacterium]|nr:adenylate/guanylate cyclase domain-containing protein [Dehalococcoidia bacterium]